MFSNEKKLEKKLREKVKEMGGWAVKFWPVNLGGFPDRIVLMPKGVIYFVEMKSTGKKPTKLQEVVHDKLRGLGFNVWVIASDLDLGLFLKNLNDSHVKP